MYLLIFCKLNVYYVLFHTTPISTSYISQILTHYRDITKNLRLQNENFKTTPPAYYWSIRTGNFSKVNITTPQKIIVRYTSPFRKYFPVFVFLVHQITFACFFSLIRNIIYSVWIFWWKLKWKILGGRRATHLRCNKLLSNPKLGAVNFFYFLLFTL